MPSAEFRQRRSVSPAPSQPLSARRPHRAGGEIEQQIGSPESRSDDELRVMIQNCYSLMLITFPVPLTPGKFLNMASTMYGTRRFMSPVEPMLLSVPEKTSW